MRFANALFAAVLIVAAICCAPAQAQCANGQCSSTFRPRAVRPAQSAPRFAPQAHAEVGGWYLGKNLGRSAPPKKQRRKEREAKAA